VDGELNKVSELPVPKGGNNQGWYEEKMSILMKNHG